ncbi:MAG: hypothetical protein HC904_00690 [Blastochloris sp.]|nr:hypothetical protein [Blastochloris sp.]
MKIAVQDANILIDLELSGTLGIWFDLGIETHTTDLILAQIQKGGHSGVLAFAASRRLFIHETTPQILAESAQCLFDHPDLEIEDAGAYLLAVALRALLLTGDKELRLLAEARCVEVHGTLWIFDRLIEKGLLKPKDAAEKLESLLAQDRYLPKVLCSDRIKTWQKGRGYRP